MAVTARAQTHAFYYPYLKIEFSEMITSREGRKVDLRIRVIDDNY